MDPSFSAAFGPSMPTATGFSIYCMPTTCTGNSWVKKEVYEFDELGNTCIDYIMIGFMVFAISTSRLARLAASDFSRSVYCGTGADSLRLVAHVPYMQDVPHVPHMCPVAPGGPWGAQGRPGMPPGLPRGAQGAQK